MTKQEIQRRFCELEARAKTILDAVGSGAMSEGQRRQLDEIMRELDDLNSQLGEIRAQEQSPEAQDALRRRFDDMRARGLSRPGDGSGSLHDDGNTRPDDERQGPLVRSGKWEELCRRSGLNASDWNGFRDESEFLAALVSGRFDPRLNARANSTLIDSEGGFSVPAPMLATIFDTALESEIVRPRSRIYAMTSQTLTVPAWQAENHTDGNLYGGFAAQWVAEGGTYNVQTPKLRQVAFAAKKLGLLARVTNELASDSPTFASALTTAMAEATGHHLDSAFFHGDGASGPLGILNSPCLITVAKETNQSAASINYTNLTKMWARLAPGSHGRAVWVASQTAIPELLSLSAAVGTGGSHIPAVVQQNGQMSLMGKPLLITEKLPAVGTVGDIMLADFSAYYVGMRADVRIDMTGAVYFTTDEMAVRLKVRLDGKPMLATPITPTNGDTLSPFVVLATRA